MQTIRYCDLLQGAAEVTDFHVASNNKQKNLK